MKAEITRLIKIYEVNLQYERNQILSLEKKANQNALYHTGIAVAFTRIITELKTLVEMNI